MHRIVAGSVRPQPAARPSGMRVRQCACLFIASAAALAAAPAGAASFSSGGNWVNAWQGSPTAGATFDTKTCPSDVGLNDQTVRNIIFPSAGGARLRIKVSNAGGTQPLRVGEVSVAHPAADPAALADAPRAVTFGGASALVVPAGGEAWSDPIALPTPARHPVAVSVYLPSATGPATQHFLATQTSYLADGNQVRAADAGAFARPVSLLAFRFRRRRGCAGRRQGNGGVLRRLDHGRLQVHVGREPAFPRRFRAHPASAPRRHLVGIECGHRGQRAADEPRSTDVRHRGRLARGARRLDPIRAAGRRAARGDQRYRRQVGQGRGCDTGDATIDRPGSRGGVCRSSAARCCPSWDPTTVTTPDYGTPAGEAERLKVNEWIRTAHAFDGVIDFDAATRDPSDPARMKAQFDSGDHLHPSDAGYEAMAQAIDTEALIRAAQKGASR
ncbi:MAG: SGNH/GDSL hydrolase family protein [Pararobbsia sp.]